MLVTNPFYTNFPLTENTTSPPLPPPDIIARPKWFRPKTTFVSLHHNHLRLSPSNSPGATRTNQYFPRHLPNMQSSEKGPRPIICLFPQQVVYLQNHYISDTKINKCVFPQLSTYLHPPRYVAPTCYTQVNELSDCHFSPQLLSSNHQLHY